MFSSRESTRAVFALPGAPARFELRLLPFSHEHVVALVRSLDAGASTVSHHPKLDSANDSGPSGDLARQLAAAIENDELRLVYQPKLNLVPRYVCGVEALVRWPHPDRGLLTAKEFIPLAEEYKLVDALGDWVVDATCRQASEWQSTSLADIRVAVNLSTQQLHDRRLAGRILRALTRHRLMPDSLDIEIRESALMNASASTLDILSRLKESGVGIAIDDFGTGFSSLSYLKTLPLDAIKIDRSFVSATGNAGGDVHSVCAAVIALAHNLGLQVIAEGVETEEQLRYLHFLDCDQVQGYHIARPMSAADVSAHIAEHRARYPKRNLEDRA